VTSGTVNFPIGRGVGANFETAKIAVSSGPNGSGIARDGGSPKGREMRKWRYHSAAYTDVRGAIWRSKMKKLWGSEKVLTEGRMGIW
jgi:hypothetical protein